MLTFSVNKNSSDVIRGLSLKTLKPTTEKGREWLSEVWFKAIEGKVDENVNVNAYGYVCDQNTKMALNKKETSLLTADEVNDGLKGVSEIVASYVDDNIDYIIESSEIKTLVEDFINMRYDILEEAGVDLWRVVKLARRYNTKMVDKLRQLIQEYDIGELIRGILEKSECLLAIEEGLAC